METILIEAAKLGFDEIVDAVLDRAVEADTELRLGEALRQAAAVPGRACTRIVERLCQVGGPAVVNDISVVGDTALTKAASHGNIASARVLLKYGADVCHGENRPLIQAVIWNDLPLLELLHSNGADVNARQGAALRLAVDKGHPEIAQFLVEKGALIFIDELDSLPCGPAKDIARAVAIERPWPQNLLSAVEKSDLEPSAKEIVLQVLRKRSREETDGATAGDLTYGLKKIHL